MITVILRLIIQRYLAARQLCTPHICKWQRGDCFSKYCTKWAIKSSEAPICSRKRFSLVSGLSFDAQVQSERWFWNQNYKNTLGALGCFQCSLKSWAVFWLFDGTVELVTAERSFMWIKLVSLWLHLAVLELLCSLLPSPFLLGCDVVGRASPLVFPVFYMHPESFPRFSCIWPC